MNWANVGTKSLDKDRLDSLMRHSAAERCERRQWRLRHTRFCLLHLPTRTRRRVEETTGVVDWVQRDAGSPAPSCTGLQMWAAAHSNISSGPTRTAPFRGDETSFAVIDCGAVSTGACWMRANPLMEQLVSRDEHANTTHLGSPPPRRPVEDSGQRSGDAGCITVACEHQFKQHCNAVDNVDIFRRVEGTTWSLASSGTSTRLLSLRSAWSHG